MDNRKKGPATSGEKVIIGENINFMGEEELLKSRGVKVEVIDNEECKKMMRDFIAVRPELWNEDIAEPCNAGN